MIVQGPCRPLYVRTLDFMLSKIGRVSSRRMTHSFIASKCHSEVYIEKRVTAGKEITKKIHYDVIIKVKHKRLVTSLELWKKSQELVGFLDRYIMMLIGFVDEMEFHI